jgi:MYXO-CTERM domain-containing protein
MDNQELLGGCNVSGGQGATAALPLGIVLIALFGMRRRIG